MAVPNTTTFSLRDVVDELGNSSAGEDLKECFDIANPALFDPSYEGNKDSLYNFRNYGGTWGTYEDWFLPSFVAFTGMQINLHDESIMDFEEDVPYWSSTEINATTVKAYFFGGGGYRADLPKSTLAHVRACRTFEGGDDDYDLGDSGPAGGYIFYIRDDGGGVFTYFEISATDISLASIWSNVDDEEIGTTLDDIGEGQNNTDEIIAQSGHTDSAANLCDIYTV